MDRILGGIYVSSSQPIIVGMDLKGKYNITHILSVIKGPLPEELSKTYKMKQIEVNDEENENIMDYFKEANRFINSALFPAENSENTSEEHNTDKNKNAHKGAILIHCSEGISRSVSFIIMYLMYRYKLSLQHSLYAVQRKREGAQPNIGFMNQLKIYEEALQHNDYNFEKIDLEAEKGYRDWIFKNQMEDEVVRNKFLANDRAFKDGTISDDSIAKDERLTQLRCKKCRQPLALSTAFIPHERPDQGSRHANFITTSAHSNRILNIERASDFCSHIFVEPLNWMKEELHKGELLGKFYCPNSRCGTKIGAYSWKGARCSCGRWVVPAISLQTAKVDEAFISEHTNFEQIKREKT